MRIDVLGVGFDDITVEQAASRAYDLLISEGVTSGAMGDDPFDGKMAFVVTPNPEIVWTARRNEALRNAMNGAVLVLPDGIGVVLGARILGSPLRGGRVPGIDFVSALFEKMAENGNSVFLLGAKPGVASAAGQNLAGKYQGLKIAGASDGYFTDDEPVVRQINSSAPDLLLVCLGAPKQELWMAKNISRLNVGLCAGLGGVLDVFAGNAKRAPVFFRTLGLEWFYRLVREPRRIKRSIKLPLFVLVVVWTRIRGLFAPR